ncbi:MAG: succinate dehydrogenase, cytochrome b556 subunit [Woeseiaceae bacterium]|nr:succinate dehydrogenase, cytochrome b556 subunit [Woeseiaceae bacterium]NIP19685.1 succinate dehydrogenase, cytochrome b556 subunit [Woeseiaceae bacterium]NIS89802.1 succinate dehydrogenase, cytochrome b556 subunit [Woeseiaceae bacterium]
MSNTERPLSPHLSIYRWPITMTLSILHRATGVAMAVGFLVLAAWLVSAATGPEEYARFGATMSTVIGQLLLVGLSFAFFYHLMNGIRHLVWDTGRGLEKRQAIASAWFVLVASIAATALFWVMLL